MATGFGGDMGSLLKQAQEMQKRMQAAKGELANQHVEGKAGGGAVVVTMTGEREIHAVKIDPAAVDPDDVETLEDLVKVAVKQALAAAKALEDQEMSKVTGGLNLPGMGF